MRERGTRRHGRRGSREERRPAATCHRERDRLRHRRHRRQGRHRRSKQTRSSGHCGTRDAGTSRNTRLAGQHRRTAFPRASQGSLGGKRATDSQNIAWADAGKPDASGASALPPAQSVGLRAAAGTPRDGSTVLSAPGSPRRKRLAMKFASARVGAKDRWPYTPAVSPAAVSCMYRMVVGAICASMNSAVATSSFSDWVRAGTEAVSPATSAIVMSDL